jgi:signal transduction histidine kinase
VKKPRQADDAPTFVAGALTVQTRADAWTLKALSNLGDAVFVTDEKPETILLAVTDSGPGIASQVKSHLFEPLHSTKPQGVGLGLVTARTFVEAHGGQIANVETPRGARFEITLPLPTEERTPNAAP